MEFTGNTSKNIKVIDAARTLYFGFNIFNDVSYNDIVSSLKGSVNHPIFSNFQPDDMYGHEYTDNGVRRQFYTSTELSFPIIVKEENKFKMISGQMVWNGHFIKTGDIFTIDDLDSSNPVIQFEVGGEKVNVIPAQFNESKYDCYSDPESIEEDINHPFFKDLQLDEIINTLLSDSGDPDTMAMCKFQSISFNPPKDLSTRTLLAMTLASIDAEYTLFSLYDSYLVELLSVEEPFAYLETEDILDTDYNFVYDNTGVGEYGAALHKLLDGVPFKAFVAVIYQ